MFKKIISSIMALAIMASIGTTVMAEEVDAEGFIGKAVLSSQILTLLVNDYYSIFDSADYSRGVTIDTKYSYRLFYHVINAYTDQYAWREVGTSLSKYYYRHTTATAYCSDMDMRHMQRGVVLQKFIRSSNNNEFSKDVVNGDSCYCCFLPYINSCFNIHQ